MKILIVGSGGREHALAWKIAQSPKAEKIYCAPGNAGIAEYAECVDIGAMEFDKLAAFAKEKEIDLTVIGMDDPLVGGIVDVFEAQGLRVFGPRKNAAILEGSKAFSKDLMKKYDIPTAAYENFDDPEKALAYLEHADFPIVLKADGLALGKGVLICNTLEEAKDGVKSIMLDKKFGSAGNQMVIEEFMTGREVSVLSFVDGKTIRIMTSAQDHKRALDGDQGLNTGGKGRQAALDGAGRGNVHEGRGLHRAVHRGKLAAAGIVLLFQQFVGHGMASSIVSELVLMFVGFTGSASHRRS